MAKEFAARQDDGWKIVGLAPDMCFTPGLQPPIPYPVTAKLGSSSKVVKTVHLNNKPAFVYNQSKVPTTIGDAAGKNKGVVSGTVEGDCWPIEHSPDTYVGGKPVIRVGDMFHMNGSAGGGGGAGGSGSGSGGDGPIVIAELDVLGTDKKFVDTNQTARPPELARKDKPTLIADRILEKTEKNRKKGQNKELPNGNMADAHAEIGAIQQAYDAKLLKGADLKLTVTGKDVCPYCKGDIAAAMKTADVKSLIVHATDDITKAAKTYQWLPGMKSLKEI